MINNLLNSTLNRASFALSEAKDQVLAASKKKAQENLDFDVPSPQDFKNKISSLPKNDPRSLEKAQGMYNKTKSLLEKAINRLEQSKQELVSIEDKLMGINKNFDNFKNLILPDNSIFRTLIDALQVVVGTTSPPIPGIVDGILATQVTPVVSGTVIDKIGEIKDAIKNSITKFNNAVNTLNPSIKYFDEESEKILRPLEVSIGNIQRIIDKLQILLDQINKIFANFILSSNLPEFQDTTTGDQDINTLLAGTTLEQYLSDPNNLSTVVEDIIIPTRKIYYEITDNGPGTELREAGIIEEPIN